MTEKIEPLSADAVRHARELPDNHSYPNGRWAATIDRAERENARLREALEWYAPHLENCRKIHREGDDARQALAADRGQRARAALAETEGK